MKPLLSKLPGMGQTIFCEMTALALETGSLNLGQGYPDYSPPAKLIAAIHQAMLENLNQYAPMQGLPVLREVIAGRMQMQHGRAYDMQDEITVTSGATEALMSSILALVHTGDDVILLDPAYDVYEPAVQLAGGQAVRVPMRAPDASQDRFMLDWDRIGDAVHANTRMIILNFPSNPSCITLKEADLDALEHLLSRFPDLLLLSDEAYEHIVFDGHPQVSPISRDTLAARTVFISSFGKTFHATGWKIGFCCAPRAIMDEIRKVHQFMVYSVSTPMQAGIARFMKADDGTIAGLSSFYQKKRDRLYEGLLTTRLRPLHSEGTFFLLVDTSALGKQDAKEMAIQMTHKVGVTAIPVATFYRDPTSPEASHGLLRLCFAKRDVTLDQAVERLQKL
ncbi:methionine aminotransferase [Castellaniella sp.]|uniref:methionine aminotransferase n=1 Tax=Castellaniella sp. TaxID=1955812 RepID=UPI0035651A6D